MNSTTATTPPNILWIWTPRKWHVSDPYVQKEIKQWLREIPT